MTEDLPDDVLEDVGRRTPSWLSPGDQAAWVQREIDRLRWEAENAERITLGEEIDL